MMDSGNEVSLKHRPEINEETPPLEGFSLNVDKENENIDNGIDLPQVNEISEDLSKAELLSSAGVKIEASATVSESKSLNPSKKAGASLDSGLRSNRVPKDQAIRKGPTSFPGKHKPSLSQSLSFPARGVQPNDLKKSTDGKLRKSDGKRSQINGTESKGSVNTTSCSTHPSRRATGGVSSNDADPRARRATLAALPSIRRSVAGKSTSMNASVNGLPQNSQEDKNSKLMRRALPNKDDEDSHSTTSSTTSRGLLRSSGSGFAFRLDERAEKRKEFFSQLEEKVQAKEAEKNNLQEKSKESQDAEIKKLRKSLTFKATPMPIFYKEPPPKVELKKIPTTRAISPKLGRNKASITTVHNSSEVGDPKSLNPSKSTKGGHQTNGNRESTTLKNPIRKSIVKLPSHKSLVTKNETKPVINSKSKTIETEHENQKTETEEHLNEPLKLSPEIEAGVYANPSEDSEMISNLPDLKNTDDVLFNG